jgi:hypothetical protein
MADPAVLQVELGLWLSSAFIPHSKSRNADKDPCLNWRVTLHRDKHPIVDVDYSARSGQCPVSRLLKPLPQKTPWDRRILRGRIKAECETGFPSKPQWLSGAANPEDWHLYPLDRSRPIKPNDLDVIYCILLDASVINHSSFEDWASDFGYDPDSRKALAMYHACMATALKLRAGLGDKIITQLLDAFQDY